MTTYKESGVNLQKGNLLIQRIKSIVKKKNRPEVLAGIGGFGGLFEIPKGYTKPVLIAGSDGVGTKLQLAFMSGNHSTIGIDLVAMSVNDILVHGAEPLFFLDYFSCGCLEVDIAEEVIKGINLGCEIAGCSLIGGETAEMPGMYKDGEYDLAGFAVGISEKDKIIDGSNISAGDQVLGLSSSGMHSNGYSLIRHILKKNFGSKYIDDMKKIKLSGKKSLLELLLEPTKIYVSPLLGALDKFGANIKGIVHITGGGLIENIPRVLPNNKKAVLKSSNWIIPELMLWLKKCGEIDDDEFFRVFNAGIGMVLVVNKNITSSVKKILTDEGETVFEIGEIIDSQDNRKIEII